MIDKAPFLFEQFRAFLKVSPESEFTRCQQFHRSFQVPSYQVPQRCCLEWIMTPTFYWIGKYYLTQPREGPWLRRSFPTYYLEPSSREIKLCNRHFLCSLVVALPGSGMRAGCGGTDQAFMISFPCIVCGVLRCFMHSEALEFHPSDSNFRVARDSAIRQPSREAWMRKLLPT